MARNYGYPTFSRLLEATQLFELRREGSVAWVRDRREGRPEPKPEGRTEVQAAGRGEAVPFAEASGKRPARPERSRGRERNRPSVEPSAQSATQSATQSAPESPQQWTAEDPVAAVVASLLSEPDPSALPAAQEENAPAKPAARRRSPRRKEPEGRSGRAGAGARFRSRCPEAACSSQPQQASDLNAPDCALHRGALVCPAASGLGCPWASRPTLWPIA